MHEHSAREDRQEYVRVRVADLSIGMFVAELDRPWSQTPFLIEGIRIDTQADLETLTRLCSHVMIDLSRSVGMDDFQLSTAQEGAPSSQVLLLGALDWNDPGNDRRAARRGDGLAAERGYVSLAAPEGGRGENPEGHRAVTQQLGWRWMGLVVRELLESYLRPLQHSPADLASANIKPSALRKSSGAVPARRPGIQVGMIREVLAKPGRVAAAAHGPTAPEWAVPMRAAPAEAARLPGKGPGAWTRFMVVFRQLLTAKRIDPAEPKDASSPVAQRQSFARRDSADSSRRTSLPLGQLCRSALLKLLGFAPPDTASDPGASTQPADDLSEEERAKSVMEYERFQREIPNAALVLKESMDALQQNYARAQHNTPLALEVLHPVVSEIVGSVLRSENAMIWLARLESHDQNAHRRGLQAAVYMAQFGAHLGLPRKEVEKLALGGAVLDIGKMQVAQEILRKPGQLDAEERRQAQAHVEIAMRMMDASGFQDARVRETVERHHEREDGSGYPRGLSGDAIGLYGRIAGIVDTFLALTGVRSYAPQIPMDECLRLLLQGRGTLFHAPLVEHFIHAIGVYPVGSLVQLSTGEVAAVLSHNRVRRLRPRVLVMAAPDGVLLRRPAPLDLLYLPRDGAGNLISIVRGLPFGHNGITAADLFSATPPQ